MNYELFQQINNLAGHSVLLDKVMIFLTNSAAFVAAVIMLALWFHNGNEEKLALRKQYTVVYTTLSVILALAINAILHVIYYHPRPFVMYHVHKLIPHGPDSSFVSDHSVLVFAIAFTLILRNDSLKKIVLSWAIIVGITRVYVGVHFPLDVIGGAFISLLTSILVTANAKRVEPIVQFVFYLFRKLTTFIPKLSKYNHIRHHDM